MNITLVLFLLKYRNIIYKGQYHKFCSTKEKEIQREFEYKLGNNNLTSFGFLSRV